jgi:hypothetical protein
MQIKDVQARLAEINDLYVEKTEKQPYLRAILTISEDRNRIVGAMYLSSYDDPVKVTGTAQECVDHLLKTITELPSKQQQLENIALRKLADAKEACDQAGLTEFLTNLTRMQNSIIKNSLTHIKDIETNA